MPADERRLPSPPFGGLYRPHPWPCRRRGFGRAGRVDEAAVVDLAGPGLVVEFALEVLAARDEDEGLLEGGIIGGQSRVAQGLDEEGGVRQVGPAVAAAVAQPAVRGVRFTPALPFVPLGRLEELLSPLDDAIVTAPFVGFVEGHEGDRGRVDGMGGLGEPTLRAEEPLQVSETPGDARLVGRRLGPSGASPSRRAP